MNINQTIAKFPGIYGVPEAARFLSTTPPLVNGYSLTSAKLRHWIRTSITPTQDLILPTHQKVITFRDLITMRLIAVLRSRGVRLQEIRKTESWLRDTLDIDWPFVTRQLWTYASDVYTEFEGHLVIASRSGQVAMDFVRGWLSNTKLDMTFDADDLAATWSPYVGIRIDPTIQLGEPCVDGTRIPTDTIRSKILAGDSVEVVAALYDIGMDSVRHALDWEERLVAT